MRFAAAQPLCAECEEFAQGGGAVDIGASLGVEGEQRQEGDVANQGFVDVDECRAFHQANGLTVFRAPTRAAP